MNVQSEFYKIIFNMTQSLLVPGPIFYPLHFFSLAFLVASVLHAGMKNADNSQSLHICTKQVPTPPNY